MTEFLTAAEARKGRWRDPAAESRGVYSANYWMGQGRDGLEVALASASDRPNVGTVRQVWKQRHGRAAAPLLLVVAYPQTSPHRAVVCGPAGEEPSVHDLDLAQAERLALTALKEPNRHLALRFLASAFDRDPGELPGLRNKGLLATHQLLAGVPQDPRWPQAVEKSKPLLGHRDHDLVRGLGYIIEADGHHQVLRAADDEHARAIAVFLQPTEQADQPSSRFNNQTPVTYALTQAERDGLKWVVAVRGGSLRLYSTMTSGAAGQRGRADTFVELNLPLLPTEQAGYLNMLFSADALAPGGTVHDIQHASAVYTSALSERLRDRVYDEVVPRLAVAVARQVGGTTETDLDSHYRTALTILFRLLFVCYAEDNQLLPLHINGEYTDHALKTLARRLAERINAGQDLGFDNPLTLEIEPATDAAQDDLWARCKALFHAVDKGHTRWGVPVYNGGLFGTEATVSPAGQVIEGLALTNADFGPALTALIVDRSPDGVVGPIDFRSLSVREFGTIYEGLLESELSVAESDLTLDRSGTYVPANGDGVAVEAGGVYLHNRSGARKSSGSYFTKPFAVEHLVRQAVDTNLDEHLGRVEALLAGGNEADAADALFDFRVADIAMGSAHFLTAVVDRLEARYTRFLIEHPIPQVAARLDRLRSAARTALGDLAETVEIENSSLLRRLIARRCIYGVDLNPIAVELARVAVWIHTFVPGLPLSFLDHNLVAGDSLTGIATIDEAAHALTAEGGQGSFFDDPLVQALRAAEEPLRRLATISDTTTDDIVRARDAHQEARDAVTPVRALFDLIVAARIDETELPTITDAGEWPDVDNASGRQAAVELGALHFPIAFPEVFLRATPGFDVIVGNPPWDKVRHEPQQFWVVRDPGLNALSSTQRDERIDHLRRTRPLDAEAERAEQARRSQLQALASTAYEWQGRGHHDYAKLFVERAIKLTTTVRGTLGYVLPRQALVLGGWASLRNELLDRGSLRITQARNHAGWFFDDVENRYMVVLLVHHAEKAPTTHVWPAVASPAELTAASDIDPVTFTADDVRGLSDTAVVPWFENRAAIPVFEKIRKVDRLSSRESWITGVSDSRWDFSGSGKHRQLAAPRDKNGSWRVLMTRHVHQYHVSDVGIRRFVNEPSDLPVRLGVEHQPDVHLGKTHPPITYRYASRNDDSRTIIAAALPRAGFLYSTGYAHGIKIDPADLVDALALLAVLNTYCCDWWARRIVDRHVTAPVLNNLPLPAWDRQTRARVASLAATLISRSGQKTFGGLGDLPNTSDFEAVPDDDLLARIELAAASGYGLSQNDVATVLDDFSDTGCPPARRALILSAVQELT